MPEREGDYMKTNKHWYPYEEFGSYFKLEDGVLLQCPMNIDGTPDEGRRVADFEAVYAAANRAECCA